MPRLRYPKCLRPAVPLIRSKIVQEDEAPRVSIYENNYKHQAVYIRLRFWKYYTLLLNWNLNDLRILIRWYKRKAAWTLILIQKQACVRWKINHHTRWKWTCESKRVLTSNTSPKQQPWGGGTRADFVGPKWNIDKRTKCKWYSVTPSSLVLNWGEESEQWRTCEKTCLERRQHLIGHGIVRVDGWRQTRKKVQHFLRLRRHLLSPIFFPCEDYKLCDVTDSATSPVSSRWTQALCLKLPRKIGRETRIGRVQKLRDGMLDLNQVGVAAPICNWRYIHIISMSTGELPELAGAHSLNGATLIIDVTWYSFLQESDACLRVQCAKMALASACTSDFQMGALTARVWSHILNRSQHGTLERLRAS
jgi:hypothetical protein